MKESFYNRFDQGTYTGPTEDERQLLDQYFSELLGEKVSSDINGIYHQLESRLDYVKFDPDGSYAEIMQSFKINLFEDKDHYVISDYPTEVVKIGQKELIKAWDEVWTPPADDAMIVVAGLELCLLLTHYGCLYYRRREK